MPPPDVLRVLVSSALTSMTPLSSNNPPPARGTRTRWKGIPHYLSKPSLYIDLHTSGQTGSAGDSMHTHTHTHERLTRTKPVAHTPNMMHNMHVKYCMKCILVSLQQIDCITFTKRYHSFTSSDSIDVKPQKAANVSLQNEDTQTNAFLNSLTQTSAHLF